MIWEVGGEVRRLPASIETVVDREFLCFKFLVSSTSQSKPMQTNKCY